MSKTSKKNVYENDMFPSGATLSDIDLRTPSELNTTVGLQLVSGAPHSTVLPKTEWCRAKNIK